MPKNARNQNSRSNGNSNVRVLHFPAASPMPADNNNDTDALADSIRKAWTQKSSATKGPSRNPGLLRLAGEKI